MRALSAWWCGLLLVGLLVGPATAANPFPGRAAADGSLEVRVPRPVREVLVKVNRAQRTLNEALSRHLRQIKESGSPRAIASVMLVALVYGVLHAAGPGHGKMVVLSFFLGRDAGWVKGVVLSGLISLLQGLSAIAIVTVLALGLQRRGFAVLDQAVPVELVSYGLVTLVGLYMTYGAVTGRAGHAHADRHADPGEPAIQTTSAGLVVAAGLTPCPSAMILLLFALGNGVLGIGVVATLVMVVGMAVTVSAVGLMAITARRALVGSVAFDGRAVRWMRRGLAVTGGLLITAVGCLFFANAWVRLG